MEDDIENPVELTRGGQYDLGRLIFGWWEQEGLPLGKRMRGYHWEAYFDEEDVYLGPDEEGIYPTFWLE